MTLLPLYFVLHVIILFGANPTQYRSWCSDCRFLSCVEILQSYTGWDCRTCASLAPGIRWNGSPKPLGLVTLTCPNKAEATLIYNYTIPDYNISVGGVIGRESVVQTCETYCFQSGNLFY